MRAHQHQSRSASVSQAEMLVHHTPLFALPTCEVGSRPKLAREPVSLPNSPIHNGARPSATRYPPALVMSAIYAAWDWPSAWNHG